MNDVRPMIDVRGARKAYGPLEVLKGIDFSVARGQIIAVIGPSGSGKSTLLRSINHLETLDSGEVWLDGVLVNQRLPGRAFERHINQVRQQMGMVFQHFNLFPHLSVCDNIAIAPAKLKGVDKASARKLALTMLEKVGLADKIDAFPVRLSGGQKQRVAIARALAMEPEVLLLDEVTSALDPELVGEVLAVIRGLADKGMTMAIVTHEMAFAADVASRVLFLDQGVIAETGSAEDVILNPQNPRLQGFVARFKG